MTTTQPDFTPATKALGHVRARALKYPLSEETDNQDHLLIVLTHRLANSQSTFTLRLDSNREAHISITDRFGARVAAERMNAKKSLLILTAWTAAANVTAGQY